MKQEVKWHVWLLMRIREKRTHCLRIDSENNNFNSCSKRVPMRHIRVRKEKEKGPTMRGTTERVIEFNSQSTTGCCF